MSAYTVGVEEEYQLVDAATFELRSGSRAVLEGDWSGEIRTELQQSAVEIGTRVCSTSRDVAEELRRLRTQVAAAAAAHDDLRIAAAGLHPFGDWRAHRVTPDRRYRQIVERYGRIARDELSFGMHVHVAVDSDRVRLLNRLRAWIPHLAAIACSSPFFEGGDTGYDSYRLLLWRRWPTAGPPPRFESETHHRAFLDALLEAGVIGDERNVYWDIRPHPEYPTLEFRMFDVCPRLEDAAAIAGLTRTLVCAADRGVLPDDGHTWSGAAGDAVLGDDTWRAARSGLRARLLGHVRPGRYETAGDAVLRLLEMLGPTAAALGEADALDGVAAIVERGNAADRMRAAFADDGDFTGAAAWIADETLLGAGMDRRSKVRGPPGVD
jgi:glutamate---cysteine ligase / carboxylate-amine ligase